MKTKQIKQSINVAHVLEGMPLDMPEYVITFGEYEDDSDLISISLLSRSGNGYVKADFSLRHVLDGLIKFDKTKEILKLLLP